MHVLITNISISSLTGTVTIVRDLATMLKRRGHTVEVFTLQIGLAGKFLAEAGIQITDDIERVRTPDVISGHHNLPTFVALARFPNVPAVWVNHGRHDWFDVPPKSPRIDRYFGIDTIRWNLLLKAGIPESRMAMLPLAVDLTRMPPRVGGLPATARTVLAFTKSRSDAPTIAAACRALGLAFDAIGIGVQRPTLTPEIHLAKADIVFATGRSAVEALCSGAAVVIGDHRGLGSFVTQKNYPLMRKLNFGTTALFRPFTALSVEQELRKYDAVDAQAVSNQARTDANFETYTDTLVRAYEEAIGHAPRAWSADDARGIHEFVDAFPRLAGSDAGEWLASVTLLRRLAEQNLRLGQ